MVEGLLVAYYYGHKTMYYLNVKSKDKNKSNEDDMINEEEEVISCESGSCSI